MSVREVEAALTNLELLARRGDAPSHYVARHLLLALGQALRECPPDACAPLVARARSAGEAAGPAWNEAVAAELGLACGEFAQSLDPRFLGLPNYDVAYTRAARARLEDRLRAAHALDLGLSPHETDMLVLADQVFAAFCAERERSEGVQQAPESPAVPGQGAAGQHSKSRKRK